MSSPPPTDRTDTVETLHGEEIADPYRWLEATDERVAAWEAAQNEYTDAFVETETREALRPRFEALAHHETYHLPTPRGGRYFQRIEAADADQPRLTVRERLDEEPRTLVDPTDLGETTALSWAVPDRSGELVVYGLMDGGTEAYDLRVIEVEGGEEVDRIDDVGRCGPSAVAWDDAGFYYLATGSAADDTLLEKELRYRSTDGDDRFVTEGTDRLVTDEIPERRWPHVQVDRTSGLVLVSLVELASDTELFVLDRNGDEEGDEAGTLVPLVTDVDAALDPLVHDGRVYLRTNHEAPRFRLLGADAVGLLEMVANGTGGSSVGDEVSDEIDSLDAFDAFDTVLPEGDDVLYGVVAAGDGLAVHRLRDAASVVSLHDADGTERHELSLPGYAGVARDGLAGNPDGPEAFVAVGGFDRPTGIVHADVGSDAGPDDLTVVQDPGLPVELDPRAGLDLTVERRWVDSRDGTRVPVYVVHRADLEPDGDTPTVLTGYGGFRIPRLPGFDPYRLAFLADGGVFAQACLRGGLEFGEEYHERGSRAHKHHVFEDFEAAAEGLVEWGYTNPARLAIWGGSNGGLLVSAAMTRRPELYGAVVCAVPLCDMLRFHRFLLGATWTPEYGSPDDPDAFEWLRAYSPYHNVVKTDYPATLVLTAAGDTRVHPGHARKMAARLQAATTGDAPICFRSDDEAGHGVGTPTSLEVEQQLDRWTFVYEMLGVEST